MKRRSKKSPEKPETNKSRAKSSEAYGDKATICSNAGCALRKKAKCFGFEGCPGFKAK